MEFVSYDIESNDFRRAGAASRAIKEHLKRIGAEAEAIRRTMIAAYEAEMNVVIHSVGGRLEASLSDSRIDVNVVDLGVMARNYDTAGGATWAMADFSGDGAVNVVDLGILAKNYDWVGAPAGAVPEPATLSLLALGGLALLRRK